MSKAKKGAERNVFAIRLESLIKERGYINETVAKGVGVTRQAVGNWVNGDSVPDILTTIKLASFFNVSTDYLLGIKNTATISVKGLSQKQVSALLDIIECFKDNR